MHPTRIFKKPEDLKEVFELYKLDLLGQANKWIKVQYVAGGERMTDPQKVPMTMEGFEVFCYNNYGCVNQYFDNKDGYYSDFVAICREIKNEIRNDQITGAMLHFYNPSITARLNGLIDKKETHISGGLNVPNLPDIGERK